MRQTGSYSVLSCWPWSSRFGASAGCAGAAAPAARPAAAARGTALRAKRTAPEKNKGGEPPPLFFLRTIEQNGNFSESFWFAFQTEDKAVGNASTCRGRAKRGGGEPPFFVQSQQNGNFLESFCFAFQTEDKAVGDALTCRGRAKREGGEPPFFVQSSKNRNFSESFCFCASSCRHLVDSLKALLSGRQKSFFCCLLRRGIV